MAPCVFVHMQVYLLNPIENLRSYINNRPPLVIFMISVSAVAIAFLTIGYFFKIKEIKSPELTEVSHTVFFQRDYVWNTSKTRSLPILNVSSSPLWPALSHKDAFAQNVEPCCMLSCDLFSILAKWSSF